jgi:hypothetical protein
VLSTSGKAVLALAGMALPAVLTVLPASQAAANPAHPVAGGSAGTAATAAAPPALVSYVGRHPGAFSGVWLNPAARTVNVGVIPGTAAAAAQAAAARAGRTAVPAGWRVLYHRARYSLSDLQQVMASVTAGGRWGRMARGFLAVWYVDNRGDQVVVGLTRITGELRREAALVFGRQVRLAVMQRPVSDVWQMTVQAPVRVKTSRPLRPLAGTPYKPGCSRLLDCYPYWGGDRLVRTQPDGNKTLVIQCTSAYPWTTKGKPANFSTETTAGHCGPTGTQWYQGYYDPSNETVYVSGIAGKDVLTQFGSKRPDGEVLSPTDFTNDVWAIQPYGAPMVKYAEPVQGQNICADGSFTGEACTGTVQSANACYDITDDLTGKVVDECDQAYATSKSKLSQSGDSGGPVYTYEDAVNSVIAAGSITAGNTSGTELLFTNINGLDSGLNGHPTT